VPDRRAAGGGAGPMSRGLVRRGGGRFRLACGILGFPAACGTLCAGAGARDSRWAWLWLERGPASRPGGREAVDGFACRVRGWASGFPRWSSRVVAGAVSGRDGGRRAAVPGRLLWVTAAHFVTSPEARTAGRPIAHLRGGGRAGPRGGGRRCRAEAAELVRRGADVVGLERDSSLSRGVRDSLCLSWCAGLPLGVALALKEGRPHALVGVRPSRVRLPGQRMGIGASVVVVSGL
jgi:hypothetical protein